MTKNYIKIYGEYSVHLSVKKRLTPNTLNSGDNVSPWKPDITDHAIGLYNAVIKFTDSDWCLADDDMLEFGLRQRKNGQNKPILTILT